MREGTADRLHRYLRVAYDGGESAPPVPAVPRRTRWAVPTGAAVRIAAVLLVVAVAGITVLVLSRGAAAPAAPVAPIAPTAQPEPVEGGAVTPSEPGESSTAGGARLVVHVAGAVARPGVTELPAGARVTDAIEAAGGATEGADLDALNLAAPVVDGQQVYVPEQGEAAPPSPAATPAGSGATGMVNLNTADASTLESLPGIGPALAQRIIDHRSEHGPFPSVEALTDVAGIGPAILDQLRDLVTV